MSETQASSSVEVEPVKDSEAASKPTEFAPAALVEAPANPLKNQPKDPMLDLGERLSVEYKSKARPEVLLRVSRNGGELIVASDEFKADKEIAMTAIERYGYSFRVLSEELRADKEVALLALRKHGHALYWASEELQADKEVVLAAVTQNRDALNHMSGALFDDMPFVIQCAAANKYVVDFVAKDLRFRELRDDPQWKEAIRNITWPENGP